jgi:hypothetical protein
MTPLGHLSTVQETGGGTDVRVANVGPGADSTWHQRFKLRE